MTKEDERVRILKDLQNYLQECLKEGPSFVGCNIWIKMECPHCGDRIRTVYYLRDDGKCKECGKSVFDFGKVKL